MDFDGKYRELPYLGVLSKTVNTFKRNSIKLINNGKKQKSTEKNNRSFFLYVGLGLLIFFGVQQYNSTVNAPENRSFTEFKNEILSNNVSEATIKEQSNMVQFLLLNDETVYQTEYPEGFEGEVFQLLVDQDIILNTDTEPAGLQEYFFAFLHGYFWLDLCFICFPKSDQMEIRLCNLVNLKLKNSMRKHLK